MTVMDTLLVNMRKIMIAFLIVAMPTLVSGCGAPHIALPRRVLPRPTLDIISEVHTSLDPVTAYHASQAGAVDQLMWNGLVNISPNGTIIPDLASHWQSLNHYQEFVLSMDPRATWWNGRPVTAHDVVWTYDFYRNPASGFPGYRALNALLRSVSVINRTQVEFTLRRPDPGFLSDWASQGSGVFILPAFELDRTAVTLVSKSRPLTEPLDFIGTGPFRPVADNEPETDLTLRKVPRYFQGNPALSDVVWRTTPPHRASSRSATLWLTPPTKSTSQPTLRTLWAPNQQLWALLPNMRDSLLARPTVLHALYQGIDRNPIARLAHGPEADGPLPPTNWYTDPLIKTPAYDPQAAQVNLMPLSGRQWPILVNADHPRQVQACQLLAHEGQKVGVDFVCSPKSSTTYYADLQQGRFLWAFVSRSTSPVGWMYFDYYSSMTPPEGMNFGFYSSAQTDSALKECLATEGTTNHMLALYRLQNALMQDPPGIFLAWPEVPVWASPNLLSYQPNPYVSFYQPQTWQIANTTKK